MGGSMTAFSPSATAILADLRVLDIDVKPHGDVIRYRPRQAITPSLLQRLQTHKAELLAMLMIQQVHDLGDDDLAQAMAEAWHERLAICTADDIPLAEAERTAMKQLQAMMGRAKGRPVKPGGERISR
jgi:hypothetical protein